MIYSPKPLHTDLSISVPDQTKLCLEISAETQFLEIRHQEKTAQRDYSCCLGISVGLTETHKQLIYF